MIRSGEESAYIDCRAVEIARYPRIVVVVIDHQPPRVSSKVEPSFDCHDYLIEVSVQVHAGKRISGRLALLVLQDMFGDMSKT